MVWIESHQDLARHPKTRKAAAVLGVSQPTMIGHLHMLWWWAMDYAPDGDLTDFDHFDIALGAGWEGDADEFIAALVDCGPGALAGFIEESDGQKFLHDWEEYGGKLHKRRVADAKRKRQQRRERAATEDNDTPSDGRPSDGQQTSSGTAYVEDKTGQDKTDKTGPSSSDLRPDQESWATDDTDVEEVRATANEVAKLIADNGHPMPGKGTKAAETWLVEMDRLLRLGPPGQTTTDPPTPEQVVEVARWATSDQFWAANVQSIPKLREKWSQLALKARDGPSRNGQPTGLEAVVAASRRAG